MSKAKDSIEQLRKKLHEKTLEFKAEKAQQEIEEKLTHIVYDVFQDPTAKHRSFLIAKLQYNPDTKEAVVMGIKPFPDKAAGLSYVMNHENMRYLYEKSRQEKK